eukprot:TRINITY_DN67152_c4_g2_i1.p2 TRINITY_DN67152_c4_g2~~TRINITY_DN67152_c4_g2_i1.p2  ORF type:complete len:102 (-),score=10.17 TRINITY_DN67152_c4_g2_i1:36-341(-)
MGLSFGLLVDKSSWSLCLPAAALNGWAASILLVEKNLLCKHCHKYIPRGTTRRCMVDRHEQVWTPSKCTVCQTSTTIMALPARVWHGKKDFHIWRSVLLLQ